MAGPKEGPTPQRAKPLETLSLTPSMQIPGQSLIPKAVNLDAQKKIKQERVRSPEEDQGRRRTRGTATCTSTRAARSVSAPGDPGPSRRGGPDPPPPPPPTNKQQKERTPSPPPPPRPGHIRNCIFSCCTSKGPLFFYILRYLAGRGGGGGGRGRGGSQT